MQLEEGLSSCGLLESVQRFPEVWKPIFIPSNQFQLTADKLLDEATVDYNSSQILKELEINSYKVFCDVIQDLYEKGKNILQIYDIAFSIEKCYSEGTNS